ncbi:MAG: AmmeMemoRadiSam system radical SAM enzyme [Anaerolineae bacterium]
MKEAMLYEKLADNKVRCTLCAHRCTIADGRVGVCHVRENTGGVLYTRVYGQTIARHVDPIEKKPLLHFYPGSTAYSVATPGCNFRCRWCQNADISQAPREQHFLLGEEASPEEIVAAAQRVGCRSIAYTYTEPTIFFEYTYDTARLAREAGLANVYVTNGYMTSEMLEVIHPYLDAANVDLKGFRDEVYRHYAGAHLQPVLDSLKTMVQLGIWVEVTTLIIPGINDDPQELQDAAQFVALELGPETPWHISRFTPAYQMAEVPPTPIPILLQAQEIGREAGLFYVYVGNVPGEANTTCHACGHLLVRRLGYQVVANDIAPGGHCPECGTPVAGRGMAGIAAG